MLDDESQPTAPDGRPGRAVRAERYLLAGGVLRQVREREHGLEYGLGRWCAFSRGVGGTTLTLGL